MCILILIIIPLHLTCFFLEIKNIQLYSHIINEFVPTRLRKDVGETGPSLAPF